MAHTGIPPQAAASHILGRFATPTRSLTGNPPIKIPFGQKMITVAMQIVLYVCGKVLGGIGCTGVVMADRAGVGAVISVVAVI